MAILRKEDRTIPIPYLILGALSLLAISLSIYRFAIGLEPTTNLSDATPWGLWITLDYFIVPVAGAAFTISLISYFFERETWHIIIRPAILAGVIGYLIVGFMLLLDIGKWHQFYNILNPKLINLHSFLEEVSLSITFYTLLLILEIAPVFFEKWNIEAPIKWIGRSIMVISGLGIIFSAMHQSSLGSMFLIMPQKIHPLWWTPALPILFFLQATLAGLSITAIAVMLIWKTRGLSVNQDLYRRIGQAMGLNIALYLAMRFGDWLGAGEIEMLMFPDAWGVMAWLEIIIGGLIPMGILFSRLVDFEWGPFWAGVYALTGIFIYRLIISWTGISSPAPYGYTPHWIEVAIAVGLISAGVLVYMIVATKFNLLPSHMEDRHQP